MGEMESADAVGVLAKASIADTHLPMRHLQASKFELMPNGQQRGMYRFAGSCHFVFNKALGWQRAQREAGEKKRPG